ncbi:hypothetical protein EV401DRAFT_2215056 [Pisolithus croceorrhizus]|nr:hypothetical protein EV401DRAFT_2215056 [Pisolithus croceorrhizus]
MNPVVLCFGPDTECNSGSTRPTGGGSRVNGHDSRGSPQPLASRQGSLWRMI